MPGQTLVMADLNGPGMIATSGLRSRTTSLDGPAWCVFGFTTMGRRRQAWIRRWVTSLPWDTDRSELDSMMVRDSSFGRARNSYWPMPFRKSCRITLTNEGNRPLPMFYYHVD